MVQSKNTIRKIDSSPAVPDGNFASFFSEEVWAIIYLPATYRPHRFLKVSAHPNLSTSLSSFEACIVALALLIHRLLSNQVTTSALAIPSEIPLFVAPVILLFFAVYRTSAVCKTKVLTASDWGSSAE